MHLPPLCATVLLQTDSQTETLISHQDQELRFCVEVDGKKTCLLLCNITSSIFVDLFFVYTILWNLKKCCRIPGGNFGLL